MCSHVYIEGVCLLPPQDCYKTITLNNACIANAHCCSSIPAHVHGEEIHTKLQASSTLSLLTNLSSHCLQIYPLTAYKLQPAATQDLGMAQT